MLDSHCNASRTKQTKQQTKKNKMTTKQKNGTAKNETAKPRKKRSGSFTFITLESLRNVVASEQEPVQVSKKWLDNRRAMEIEAHEPETA